MGISSIGPSTAFVSNMTATRLQEIDIKSTPAQVDIKTGLGKLDIQMREPEMDINWERVLDSIGLQGAESFMKSISSGYLADYSKQVQRTISEGKQIAKSAADRNDKIFSQIVTNRYMEEHAVETSIGLMPEAGPEISVKTYLPAIQYEAVTPEFNVQLPTLKVTLKPAGSTSSMIDQRV
ncbi:hypothetical protein D3C78_1062900 [compost metagenome]